MTTVLAEQTVTGSEARIVDTIVAAFAADPAVRWLYPDLQQFQVHFPDFVRAFAGKAFACGTADEVSGFACGALWLPPGVLPDEAAVVEVLRRSVNESQLPEIFQLFEQMDAHHPHKPHWYLPLMGVHPDAQGRGCGSVLLRRALARCDRDHVPAYLEATHPRNVSLYTRFGFKAVGLIQTKTSLPIIPMLRRPGKRCK